MSKAIILTIVILFVVAAAGFALIYFYNPDASSLQTISQPSKVSAPKILYSEMVSMYANGKISKIDGSKIAISSGQDSLAINFKNNTIVQKIGSKEPFELKDLKIGESVYTSFKLLSDNTFQGISITLTPPAK